MCERVTHGLVLVGHLLGSGLETLYSDVADDLGAHCAKADDGDRRRLPRAPVAVPDDKLGHKSAWSIRREQKHL